MLLLPPATLTPEAFGELLVGSPTGTLVPLASVATIRETEGPAVINREALQRRVLVEANVRGRDLVSFVQRRAAPRGSAEVTLPDGRHRRVGRAVRELHARERSAWRWSCRSRWRSSSRMLFLMFGDLRSAVAVFAGAPFALVGGVAGAVRCAACRSRSRRRSASSPWRASRC